MVSIPAVFRHKRFLVVLADVGVGVVEEGSGGGELVFGEDESDLFAGFTVAGLGFVPAGERDLLGDGVDVPHESVMVRGVLAGLYCSTIW
jgi:hypothetical protein